VTIPIPVTTTRRKANLQKNQVEIGRCASPDWPCTAQILSKR
jgi:hypothetical protein